MSMWVHSRASVGLIFCLAALANLLGCDKATDVSSQQDVGKFELSHDSRGRTIRINKVTGETAILDGDRFVPVKVGKEKVASSGSPMRDPAPSKSTSPAARPAVAPVVSPESEARPASVLAAPGSTVKLTIAAPLFLFPDAHREPLRIGPAGSALRVLSVDADWYQVEFSDPQWGQRVGYVQTKYAKAESSDLGVTPSVSPNTNSAGIPQSQPMVAPAATTMTAAPVPAVSAARKAPTNGKRWFEVRIIDRQDSATNYTYVVPGYWNSTSNTNVNCFDNIYNVNCNGSTRTTGSGAPAQRVSYQVNGATFSLQLPDGRVAVVNCASKLNWTDWSNPTVYRSCRIPLVNNIQAEFDGDNAKLWWPVSIDGRKMESETYKILAVLDRR